MTDPTAAERIADAMAGRAEDIGALQAISDSGLPGTDGDGYPLGEGDADQRLSEMPLSVVVARPIGSMPSSMRMARYRRLPTISPIGALTRRCTSRRIRHCGVSSNRSPRTRLLTPRRPPTSRNGAPCAVLPYPRNGSR
jgi:hypothetical protein